LDSDPSEFSELKSHKDKVSTRSLSSVVYRNGDECFGGAGRELAVVAGLLGGAVLGNTDKISPAIEVLGIIFAQLQSFRSPVSPNPDTLPSRFSQTATMPSLLGKRKSRAVEEDPESLANAQEILRRHFEAHFKPLPVAARAAPKKKPANDLDSDNGNLSQDGDDSDASADQSDGEWGGVSDDENKDGMRISPSLVLGGYAADAEQRRRHPLSR
jgi:hypothetical protein